MKATLKYKPTGEQGTFFIKETIQLPFITLDPSLENKSTTFIKDGTVEGLPVIAQILGQTPKGLSPIDTGTGVLIQEQGGAYLIPDKFIGKRVEETPSNSNNENSENENPFIQRTDGVKQIFGFSLKQMAVITVVAILINKLLK